MTGKKRKPWGAVGLALSATFAVLGCQDGYPIAASRCDELCDAMRCGYDDPAACVVGCESAGLSLQKCEPDMAATLACWRMPQNRDTDCNAALYSGMPLPCSTLLYSLYACGSDAQQGGRAASSPSPDPGS